MRSVRSPSDADPGRWLRGSRCRCTCLPGRTRPHPGSDRGVRHRSPGRRPPALNYAGSMGITTGLRSGIRQWASQAHAEAVDLQRDVAKAGCLRIENAPDREMVTVQGTLRTVTLRPRGGVPALEAEL